jgi:hypothetical protein
MKSGRIVLGILGIALVVGMAFTGTALAQGPWGDEGAGTGVCDEFVDENNDGICDNRPEGHPLLRKDSEERVAGGGYRAGGAGMRGAYGDADGDGLCDRTGEPFVDENNDGICDNAPETGFRRGRMATQES